MYDMPLLILLFIGRQSNPNRIIEINSESAVMLLGEPNYIIAKDVYL